MVLRRWCYLLSAISRRLATAVAHLLYDIIIPKRMNLWQKKKESVQIDITYVIISDYDEVTKLRCQDKGLGTGWLLREVPLQMIFIGALGR